MVSPSNGMRIIDYIYKNYSANPGKILVHAGVIGWVLSSAAQISAIIFNDKIPKEQKMFLIPQEFADACVNILSFYAVTRTFTAVATKLVKTGKWILPGVKKYLQKHNLANNIGNPNFDISTVKMPYSLRKRYNWFNYGLDATATTIGSILSSNIITPVFRNLYASHRQQNNIAKINTTDKPQVNDSRKNKVAYLSPYSSVLQKSSGLKV